MILYEKSQILKTVKKHNNPHPGKIGTRSAIMFLSVNSKKMVGPLRGRGGGGGKFLADFIR